MKLAISPVWFQLREPHGVKTAKNLLSVVGPVLIALLHISCMIYTALLNTHVYAHTYAQLTEQYPLLLVSVHFLFNIRQQNT